MSTIKSERSSPAVESGASLRGPCEGWVVRTGSGREVWVDFPGNRLGPLRARVSPTLDIESVRRLAFGRPPALLLFVDGSPEQPVLLMLLEPSTETPLTDAVLSDALSRLPMDARVDSQRVVLTGRQEIVLECGKASLTLRSDGEIVIRGVNVLTEADGLHRIRGRKVRIN